MHIELPPEAYECIEQSKKKGISREVFVVEECAELIKEIMKYQRYSLDDTSHDIHDNTQSIFEEACDVLGTVLQMLADHGYSSKQINNQMLYKFQKALGANNADARNSARKNIEEVAQHYRDSAVYAEFRCNE